MRRTVLMLQLASHAAIGVGVVRGQAVVPENASNRAYNGRLGRLNVSVPRVGDEPRIDGQLTEASWNGAALLTGFSQYSPVDGVPANDSTEVRVMYSERALYVGVRAFESHGAVIVTRADRDRIAGDDHIRLMLDTFNDRRRAIVFGVNPLGVQSDGVYSEGGNGTGALDLSPDFAFESRGRVTVDGYEVEIRIPFKSLRYQSSAVQDWSIQVVRAVQHSGHEQTWTPASRGAASFLAQSGTLAGLTGVRRGLVLDVNPVVTSQTIGAERSATDPTWEYRTPAPEFGANVRWGMTPNVTMSGTVNPDFSQVEADVGQVVFDPRAAIAFPEKRPFFLEASENFQTPNSLIRTRSVRAPLAAVKVSGKIESTGFGILSAADDKSLSVSGSRAPLFNLLRIRRDLGAQSNIGIVYTDRTDDNDYNRVAGVDARLSRGGLLVAGQIATSFTQAQGIGAQGHPLFDFSVVKPGRSKGFTALFKGVHPGFFTAAGFVPRRGITQARFSPRWSFFPKGRRLEAVSIAPILDGTWEWDRFQRGTEPNDIKVQASTTASWRGGWGTRLFTFVESFKYPAFLYSNYHIERRDNAGAVIDTVPYVGTDRLPNYGFDTELTTPQFQRFSGSAQLTGGHDENFDEWSSAWIVFSNVTANWRPTDRVRLSARYLEQRFFRVSDGSLVRVRVLPRVKLEYQMTRAVLLRYVGQYDATKVDSLRDDSRTNDPVLIRSSTGTYRRAGGQRRAVLRNDVLFSFQPNPGTVLFAGYGASTEGIAFDAPSRLERSTDGFFVKASYLFRM